MMRKLHSYEELMEMSFEEADKTREGLAWKYIRNGYYDKEKYERHLKIFAELSEYLKAHGFDEEDE